MKPPPAPAVPVVFENRTCLDAAVGLDRSTKTLRPPEDDVVGLVRERCAADGWSAAAIECFAAMTEGDLMACTRLVLPMDREKLLATLVGNASDDGEEEPVADLRVISSRT